MPNLFDTLLERMEGRKYNDYFSAFCPFDTHKSPALLVYEDGFVCLSCGKKGSLKYLNTFTGSHFIPQRNDTVSRILPLWRNWEQRYGDLEGIVDAAHRTLKKYPKFQTYFKERKIYEYVDEGTLGYLEGWITFPVIDRSHSVCDIVVRSTHSDMDKGNRYVVHPSLVDVHRQLYCPSWDRIDNSKTVYVVYGIIDAISLHLAGLPSVTGVTGKSLKAEQLLPLGKRFVIVPDDGEEREAHILANKIGWKAKVKQLSYPEGTKDCDDVRRIYGNEYLLGALA
jgi:DNA primase